MSTEDVAAGGETPERDEPPPTSPNSPNSPEPEPNEPDEPDEHDETEPSTTRPSEQSEDVSTIANLPVIPEVPAQEETNEVEILSMKGELEEIPGEIDLEFEELMQILQQPVPFYSTDGRKSIFSHCSPSQFPDIRLARQSVFGSIFVRTSVDLPSHLNLELLRKMVTREGSYDYQIGGSETFLGIFESEVKRSAYTESLWLILEQHRQSIDQETWDVYPITHPLYSIKILKAVHQTRRWWAIEDRIVTGPVQILGLPHTWPTDSMWTGYWDSLGMAGTGVYVMPHGVTYYGNMVDGMFHDDDATLIYPNGFKALHCHYDCGKMLDCQFQFPDGLDHDNNDWQYCQMPDRRYWSEIQTSLKPAKIAQKTQRVPTREIPAGCYDTNDGFYDPKTKMLLSPEGELLRVPTKEEEEWIMKHCRKGFDFNVGFRPDLFENWYNFDTEFIAAILDEQERYRNGEITFHELQQFYADHDLMPSHSKYKKTKTMSQIALDEYFSTFPQPKVLKTRLSETKFKGHKIPDEVIQTVANAQDMWKGNYASAKPSFAQMHGSRISFKVEMATGRDPLQRVMSSKSSMQLITAKPSFTQPRPQSSSKSILKQASLEQTEYVVVQPPKLTKKVKKHHKKHVVLDNKVPDYTPEEEQELIKHDIREVVLAAAEVALRRDEERCRRRVVWARSVSQESFGPRNAREACLRTLQEMYDSVPECEEYCESDPSRTADLKKLAQDKHNELKYWGRRMFSLEFTD